MRLILTHENADFDAIAASWAAHRLYPDTRPLLPRRINHNVEQFLLLYWGAFRFTRVKEWKKQRIDKVILVDTHSLNSVRGMVAYPDVLVIDHHTTHKRQEKWQYEVEAVGAATTLLVEKMMQTGLTLSSEEATLFLLGIYEDTGSGTYDTTTARALTAAAWLIEQRALLPVVRRFMSIPLTLPQRELYDRLQTAVSWQTVHGRSLAIAMASAPTDFEDEISAIVHRLRDALMVNGLLVLVQIGQDVQFIARSSHTKVDVSIIARQLGGGGHSRAAAALIPKTTLAKVEQQIVAMLPEAVQPMTRVIQLMSLGVQTIDASTAVNQAATKMQQMGHEGYPVVDEAAKKLVGLLTRRAVDRAMSHGMETLPVSRIMRAGVVSVRPSDSIARIQQLMLSEGWGQIPVLAESAPSNGLPMGIVTRTDLLNHLFKPAEVETAVSDMSQLLQKSLHPALWQIVQQISAVANQLTMPLYFVGGLVRDLLLDKSPTDLDMVVEGDAIQLARSLQEKYGGDVHAHGRFGTAKWSLDAAVWQAVLGHPPSATELSDLTSIDFVTARSEFYTEPTVLPTVSRGSIKLDLHRRDFAINTLAVRLDGAHLGELLDFYGGQRDLEQGIIRVLHSLSFVDDPTRILRAARLEQRLHFVIEPRTAELIHAALPLLDRVTGSRIRHEIELAFRELDMVAVLTRFADIGVMSHISLGLEWSEKASVCIKRAKKLLQKPLWQRALGNTSSIFVYFALWMLTLPRTVRMNAMTRLMVRKATRQDVTACVDALAAIKALPINPRPSEVEKSLRPFPSHVLLVVRIALRENLRAKWIVQYCKEWRWVKTAVDGHYLRQIGLKPGPHFAVILDQLRAACLDGEISTAAEEHALLAKLVKMQVD